MGAMNAGRLLPVSVGCEITERQITCRAGHIHYMLKELCPTLFSLSLSLSLSLCNMHDHEESATCSLLYGCGTWSVTLWVQARLKVLQARY